MKLICYFEFDSSFFFTGIPLEHCHKGLGIQEQYFGYSGTQELLRLNPGTEMLLVLRDSLWNLLLASLACWMILVSTSSCMVWNRYTVIILRCRSHCHQHVLKTTGTICSLLSLHRKLAKFALSSGIESKLNLDHFLSRFDLLWYLV